MQRVSDLCRPGARTMADPLADARPSLTERPTKVSVPIPGPSSAFRHDPGKFVLSIGRGSFAESDWGCEPAVCGYRRLIHHSHQRDADIPVPVCAAATVVMGAGVLVSAFDGYVRFLSPQLDHVFWERRLDAAIYASPVVDLARRHLIVAATSGLIVCLDLRGRTVWSFKSGSPIYATPTVSPQADIVVFATFHSRCFGLNLATGALIFDRDLPRPWYAACGGSAAQRDPYASPATTSSGALIICCAEEIICLSPDGTDRWRRHIGCGIRSSPAALHATDEVVVGAVNGHCLFLDGETGQIVADISLGAKITASPAVSGGYVVFGASDDQAFGLSLNTHAIVWKCAHGAPRDHSSYSVTPAGDFIATVSRGNVVCRRPCDGAFLWETSQLLGLPDHDPIMDTTPIAAANGSLYCASYSGVLYHFRFAPQNDGSDCI